MHVLLNGWFAGQLVGSGQYTDHLLAALRAEGLPGDSYELLRPVRMGSLAKVWYEQVTYPLATRRSDVAHVPYWAPPFAPRVPTVVTVHDLIPLVLPAYGRRWPVRAYVQLVRRATPRVAAVIVDSQHTARDITRRLGLPPARVHVVPLGVDLVDDVPEEKRAALRQRLDLPARFGLYLGGFDHRKNLATLLAAWRGVYAATGVPLVIAGRLPATLDPLMPHPAALAEAARLPSAAWRAVGPIAPAHKATLFAAAAVFAFPSRYEGFGLPPLEALAAGCPVVAADATSLPEVVGDAGLLVDPENVGAWERAICHVLGDSTAARGLSAAGQLRARGFTWAKTAAATRAVYQSVWERGAGPCAP